MNWDYTFESSGLTVKQELVLAVFFIAAKVMILAALVILTYPATLLELAAAEGIAALFACLLMDSPASLWVTEQVE